MGLQLHICEKKILYKQPKYPFVYQVKHTQSKDHKSVLKKLAYNPPTHKQNIKFIYIQALNDDHKFRYFRLHCFDHFD